MDDTARVPAIPEQDDVLPTGDVTRAGSYRTCGADMSGLAHFSNFTADPDSSPDELKASAREALSRDFGGRTRSWNLIYIQHGR